MGFLASLHYANASSTAPVPDDGDKRGLRQKMLDLYNANNAEILTVIVALRHQRRSGLFLSMILTDEILTDQPAGFAQSHEEENEIYSETTMAFRMTRGLVARCGGPMDALEELIGKNFLYPI